MHISGSGFAKVAKTPHRIVKNYDLEHITQSLKYSKMN